MPALVSLGGAAFLSEPISPRLLIASAAMLDGIALVLGRRCEPPTLSRRATDRLALHPFIKGPLCADCVEKLDR
jgi:hypothetical protein